MNRKCYSYRWFSTRLQDTVDDKENKQRISDTNAYALYEDWFDYLPTPDGVKFVSDSMDILMIIV